ncbi:FMRFamide peptide receptor frpr-18-like [Tubulanus polymorphus]|uniref:FMRFamide peptide receptor frpr-18-like n=1 Tax=Tubulanus polymorphus TaxID=672921 RepID=UPI003DA427C2
MTNSTAADEIGRMIVVYGAPFVLLFGLVGNTLIITTFSGKRLRYKSYAWLFICLSVSDSGLLSIDLVVRWTNYYYRSEYDFRGGNSVLCVAFLFLAHFFAHASPWMLVLITMERCVSVVAPMRAKIICSRKRMIYASLLVIFLVFAINSHMFYGMRITQDGFCREREGVYLDFWSRYWLTIHLVIASAAPFAVLLICNAVIIYFLKRAESRRQTQTSAVTNNITLMLVTTNFTFFVTSFPFTVVIILRPASILVHVISAMLMYVNYAINFWLYCFTGRMFREELIELCSDCRRRPCCDCRHRKDQEEPTAYNTTSPQN